MKAKWYISTLLIAFTFLGAFQEKILLPNQEIVLEFNNQDIAKNEVENTIKVVKKQLFSAGASNIKVYKTKNNTLKISYFSTINASNIKEALSNKNKLSKNNVPKGNFPFKKFTKYNIDVHELSDHSEVSNFDNNSILLEFKSDINRSHLSKDYAPLNNSLKNEADKVFKRTYKFNRDNINSKDNTLHYQPEVRAGPSYFYI
ncbi:hypothetical protein [Polaribacter sargassicola]|uniref:hypothetical protein n=1 Tax=Polaribacter sargassicola TaxID=2836891 RepID=UPI001F240758|nr:hypothetical protein [Polaribacter sp. DS7-9]MCG1035856.1 hypothetical protein [Polaribacter sp. DS7-9]